MFQDRDIFGTATQSIDSKNRLVLPKFCGAEENDEVIVYQEEDFLSIYQKKYFLDSISKVNFLNNKSFDDFLTKKAIYDLKFARVLMQSRVDKYRRIQLSKEIVLKYSLIRISDQDVNNSVLLKGAWDHVNVFLDTEHMNRSLKLLKR